MTGDSPGRWLDRLIGWCFGVLAAAVALYCAVSLIEAIMPALIIVMGTLALMSVTIGAIVVIRAARTRW